PKKEERERERQHVAARRRRVAAAAAAARAGERGVGAAADQALLHAADVALLVLHLDGGVGARVERGEIGEARPRTVVDAREERGRTGHRARVDDLLEERRARVRLFVRGAGREREVREDGDEVVRAARDLVDAAGRDVDAEARRRERAREIDRREAAAEELPDDAREQAAQRRAD